MDLVNGNSLDILNGTGLDNREQSLGVPTGARANRYTALSGGCNHSGRGLVGNGHAAACASLGRLAALQEVGRNA